MLAAILATAALWLTLIYVSVEQYRARLQDFDQHGSEYPPNGESFPVDLIRFHAERNAL